MDIGEVVRNALKAEQQGIPINWKELCVTVLNAAVQRVKELEDQVDNLSHPPPDESLETSD